MSAVVSHFGVTCFVENEYEWFNVYIEVSSVCSEPPPHTHTHSRSHRAGNLHSCCSWSRVSPVCALALKHFGSKNEEKKLKNKITPLIRSSSSSAELIWSEECSYSPLSAGLSVSSLCRVHHRETCPAHFCCIFAVSWVAPFCCIKLVTCSCHLYECPRPSNASATLVLYVDFLFLFFFFFFFKE